MAGKKKNRKKKKGSAVRARRPAARFLYTPEEARCVQDHITSCYGPVLDRVATSNPSADLKICIVPQANGRDCATLVTEGLGAMKMNVPQAGFERAELAIALPVDWNTGPEMLSDSRWRWPFDLLSYLAGQPLEHGIPLMPYCTYDLDRTVAEGSALCGALLVQPECIMNHEFCTLPGGDRVWFYSVLPLYEDEMDYLCSSPMTLNKIDELLGKISCLADLHRPDALTGKVPSAH